MLRAKALTAWPQRWMYALLLELACGLAMLAWVGQKALLMFISLLAVAVVAAAVCLLLHTALGKHLLIRLPGEGRGPRTTQVVDFAERVDPGLRRDDENWQLISVFLAWLKLAKEAPRWQHLRAPIIELATFAVLTFALSQIVFATWRQLAPDADIVIAGALPFVLVHCLFAAAFVLAPQVVTRLQQADAARIAERNAERLRVTALERSLALSELKTLQAQIEPHFLYNVLANVQSMVKLAPDTADAMLMHLIDYLKLALPSMRGGESTVGAELELARAYLAIAQLRFGDRLQARVNCDAALASNTMPPMLLLPLVENAVKHGVEPKPGAVQVHVNVSAANGALTFQVRDTGAGFTHDAGSGVGIANVRERLAALFKNGASVSVEAQASGGVVATLMLPISL